MLSSNDCLGNFLFLGCYTLYEPLPIYGVSLDSCATSFQPV